MYCWAFVLVDIKAIFRIPSELVVDVAGCPEKTVWLAPESFKYTYRFSPALPSVLPYPLELNM